MKYGFVSWPDLRFDSVHSGQCDFEQNLYLPWRLSVALSSSLMSQMKGHVSLICNVNTNVSNKILLCKKKENQHQAKHLFIWPKRAINKILFSRFINKPQEVHGCLPQHLKHLILAQSTKTWGPFEILWAADKSEGSLPYFLRKIKQNMVILYQTGGWAAGWSFSRREGCFRKG